MKTLTLAMLLLGGCYVNNNDYLPPPDSGYAADAAGADAPPADTTLQLTVVDFYTHASLSGASVCRKLGNQLAPCGTSDTGGNAAVAGLPASTSIVVYIGGLASYHTHHLYLVTPAAGKTLSGTLGLLSRQTTDVVFGPWDPTTGFVGFAALGGSGAGLAGVSAALVGPRSQGPVYVDYSGGNPKRATGTMTASIGLGFFWDVPDGGKGEIALVAGGRTCHPYLGTAGMSANSFAVTAALDVVNMTVAQCE